ncbi:MAG: hypothetical protein NE327_21035 [Lentisphaeraceae bacterium]|nr:hypothetical protein [Lentisphaeraceae bacterium]
MFWNEIKKIASAAGFIIGIITLGLNLINGHTLLHSAYTAILMMFAASIVILLCLRGIGNILTAFLLQKKAEADKEKEKRAKDLAREKLEELKARRKKYENSTREKLASQAGKINNENKQHDLEGKAEPLPDQPSAHEESPDLNEEKIPA